MKLGNDTLTIQTKNGDSYIVFAGVVLHILREITDKDSIVRFVTKHANDLHKKINRLRKDGTSKQLFLANIEPFEIFKAAGFSYGNGEFVVTSGNDEFQASEIINLIEKYAHKIVNFN